MSFMEPEEYDGPYVEIEDGDGATHYLPADVFDDLGSEAVDTDTDRDTWTVKRRTGKLYRLSAPGYLDCTDWSTEPPTDDEEE